MESSEGDPIVSLEVKDLAGLSQPLTKLIEVVSSAIGTLYEPRGVRVMADSKAYEIKAIARAQAEAGIETMAIQTSAIQDRIATIARDNPELAQRARQRLLAREIEGQMNVERIAEQATLALPPAVSPEPVSVDWRRKFFQEAENVCEVDMQALWGKVLAGEIAQPGAFGLRTLETLKQLSRREAELFRQLCSVAMTDGWVALPGHDINTALMPFGFTFDTILALRDAGLLLHGDGIHNSFPTPPTEQPEVHRVVLVNNGIFIELSGAALGGQQMPALILTQAGKELQRLIEPAPNEKYLASLGNSIRQRGVAARRGSAVPQSETTTLLVFEQDL